MIMPKDRLLGALAVAAAACLWGTLGYFAKVLYAEGVSFESVVVVRAGLGWMSVMLFLLATGNLRKLLVSRRDLPFLVPLGLVGIGVFYLLFFFTLQESTVGTTVILLYSSPAFVVLLAWLFLGESLGLAKLLALLMTCGGILLVVGGYDPTNLEVGPLVLATGLLSGLAYGLYSIFGKPVAGRLPSSVILAYALFFGTALILGPAVPTLGTLAGLPPIAYATLIMLAVVHTTGGFALYTFGLGKLGAGRAAIVAAVEPVIAVAIGVALLGEELTAVKILGAGLVIGGALLAQGWGRSKGQA
jgi:drug/metabolite transporter, DME family